MTGQFWLLLLPAILVLFCSRRRLCRLAAMLLRGRTRRWRLRVARDGTLRSRGLRLRLYGVADAGEPDAIASLKRWLVAGRVCWRVLSVDDDGTAAILLRCAGSNAATDLLRQGLVIVRGSGARNLRTAQETARLRRLGRWQCLDRPPVVDRAGRDWRPLPFPWWQG